MRILIGLIFLGMSPICGCVAYSTYRPQSPEITKAISDDWDRNYEHFNALKTAVSNADVPKNFESKLAKYFEETLIDPDSRRVTFGARPFGGLLCGDVNAKNTFGGYTGRQPFYVAFDQKGEIVSGVVLNKNYERVYREATIADSLYEQSQFLKMCGSI